MPITGWVAVFYPHKFYVGRVIDVPKNGNPSVKFLHRRPGDVFVYRRDTEKVEKKSIFRRGLSVKRGLLSKTMAALKRSTRNLRRSTFVEER